MTFTAPVLTRVPAMRTLPGGILAPHAVSDGVDRRAPWFGPRTPASNVNGWMGSLRWTMSDPCLGPIDPASDLPEETCGEAATKMLFFPHQSGVAFMFACDRHLESLGRWAGTRFGGCFAGGPIAKGARVMSGAPARVGRIH